MDLNEPLTAVRHDPDTQAVIRIDVESLVHTLWATAVQQAEATFAQPSPRRHEQLPLSIKPAHFDSLSGTPGFVHTL